MIEQSVSGPPVDARRAAQSRFHIPCLCGATVLTHARETRCERCGRQIVLEWGKEPVVIEAKRSEEPR
jgi:hypothetical protein